MLVRVNDKSVEVPDQIDVQKLLDTVDVPPNYLAVEINGDVIAREDYRATEVKAGDQIEVVTLVGGG